jgi:hypothetical protein
LWLLSRTDGETNEREVEMVWMWLMACSGMQGFTDGVLEVRSPEGDEVELKMKAGALTFTQGGDRVVVMSTVKRGFTCEYLQEQHGRAGGKDIDRRRDHQDLTWWASDPGRALLTWNEEGLFGGGGSLAADWLEAEMVFDDGPGVSGELVTEAGSILFEAEDCGKL